MKNNEGGWSGSFRSSLSGSGGTRPQPLQQERHARAPAHAEPYQATLVLSSEQVTRPESYSS
jgi:hypothetical protein